MKQSSGVILGLLLLCAPAQAQTLVPGGPSLIPVQPELAPGLSPQYQPKTLPTSAAAKPGADIAFGAFQRGYYATAMREAMKRLDTNRNDAAAMTLIGEIIKEGYSVKRDPAEAAHWYKLAADRGDRQATFALALAALQGSGIPKDKALAKTLFQKAAAAGHSGALYNLGIMAIDNEIQDFKAAADYFRRAADAGNMDGAYSLAVLYREGKGVPKDLTQSAEWLRRAAAERNVAAEVEYAIMLFNGEGVPKDEKTAARFFLRAAGRNNPVAMNRIARLYASGRGVDKNMVEAMKWHILARTVGLQDEWLDGLLNGLGAQEKAAVEDAVRQYIGN
ncbi:MAG: sel1 repeat family protein [Hyphomicrobiales bacterium]|nr:sel1 repeat family protein [Hyphomicrobiales bacterium]